jgi:hypothetical protein
MLRRSRDAVVPLKGLSVVAVVRVLCVVASPCHLHVLLSYKLTQTHNKGEPEALLSFVLYSS